jgi:hypothetical protein
MVEAEERMCEAAAETAERLVEHVPEGSIGTDGGRKRQKYHTGVAPPFTTMRSVRLRHDAFPKKRGSAAFNISARSGTAKHASNESASPP